MMQEHTCSWTPVAATIQGESVERFGWLTIAVYVHEHTDGLQHISVRRIIISIRNSDLSDTIQCFTELFISCSLFPPHS